MGSHCSRYSGGALLWGTPGRTVQTQRLRYWVAEFLQHKGNIQKLTAEDLA